MIEPKLIESGISRRDPDRELEKALGEVSAVLAQRAGELLQRIKRLEEETIAELEKFTPTERLLNVEETAAYLGFSRRTISKWASGDTPKLPFIVIGSEKRFRLSDLTRWMETRTIRPKVVRP